jgi:phage terminase large subunit-like protein
MRGPGKKSSGGKSGGRKAEAVDPAMTVRAAIERLSRSEAEALQYDWNEWARDNQRAPGGEWATWLILAGRGFGKTRVGAEMVRGWVKDFPFVNLIGATADDARDIMIEGESGILAICPGQERPRYLPSKRRL